MQIDFFNGVYCDGREYTCPFPNAVRLNFRKFTFGFGILGMWGDNWEERIMWRGRIGNNMTQFRFLIFAIAWR